MPLTLPTLRIGSVGPEVGNWQRFLSAELGAPLSADEAFGPRTDHATRTWQLAHRLVADGIVGNMTRAVAIPRGFIQFLQARYFTRALAGRSVDLVVIHDMEYPEKPESAEWCAQFFAGAAGMTAPRASAHFCVDSDSVVQCVRTGDVAWHAMSANRNGIGVEHAGYARQSRADWLDDYSRAELTVSAQLVARLCKTHGIPVAYVDADGLRTGERGITGHADVTKAFGGTHWDPGPGFPWDEYLALVRAIP